MVNSTKIIERSMAIDPRQAGPNARYNDDDDGWSRPYGKKR